MSLTNDGKRMFQWAQKEQDGQITDRIFSKFDASVESYYEKCDGNDKLVYEYDFETFAELKKEFSQMWKDESYMQDAVLISAAAAMRHKPTEENTLETVSTFRNAQEGEAEIPEYVYVF